MHACGVHAHERERGSIVPAVQPADNVPGGQPTATNPTNLAIVRVTSPYALYQIPRCMSASAGRVRNLKFHSGRRRKERERRARTHTERGEGGVHRDERIAEQAIYSNRWFIRASPAQAGDDRSFPPTGGAHLCPDSRPSRTWSSVRRIHCPF